MALNAGGLGIGFALGLKDTGFDKGMKNAEKTASMFQRSLEGIKTVGGGMAGLLKSAFRLPQVGPIASQIQSAANDYKITTTNVEALGIASDKVSSQVLAGLNLTGKKAKEFGSTVASVSYGLNMDAGTVAESLKAVTQSGIDLKKLGFKNFTQFQKFVSVTGVDVKKFTATMSKLGSQFGMNDDQVKDTLQSVLALGKKFNVGNEAAQSMANTVGMLADEGASLWAELGPERTKKFLEGTQALSIAFLKAGHTAEEAQDLALGVGKAMIKGRSGVQRLFSGLDEDLSDVMKSVTENFGSAEGAFQLLQQDPQQFTKSIAMVVKKIKSSGKPAAEIQEQLARLSNQMTESFGPQFASLIGGNVDKTIEAFSAVEKELGRPGGLADKNGVLGKMAANYRDGLTPTERLGRAQDQFRTKLKKLMGETDAQFLKRFNHSAGVTSEQLVRLVKKGGPLGKATEMMVEFSNHGIGGVATKINKDYGPAMAVLIQQFGPVIQHLGQMLPAVMALMNPFTLLAAGVAGVWYYFKQAKEGGGKFKDFIDQLIPKVISVGRTIVTGLFEMLPKIGAAIADMWSRIDWNQVYDFMVKAGHLAWRGFLKGLEMIGQLGKWIVDKLANIDWAAVGHAVYEGAKKVGGMILDGVVYVIEKLPDIVLGIIEGIGTMVGEALSDIWDSVTDGIEMDELKALERGQKTIEEFNRMARERVKQWEGVEAQRLGVTLTVEDKIRIAHEEQMKVIEKYGRGMVGQMQLEVLAGKMDSIYDKALADRVAKAKAAAVQAANAAKNVWGAAVSEGASIVNASQLKDSMASGAKLLLDLKNKAKKSASEATLHTAAKELGMDVGDAANVIKAVASMSPGEIKKNLTNIKTYYISFLKEASKESKSLLEESRKFFNQFIQDQTIIWSDRMVSMVSLFADGATRVLTDFWSRAIMQAKNQSLELVRALGGTVTSMDITTGGGMYGSPVATAPAFTQGYEAAPAGVNPLSNLISSIHNPKWVDDMKEHMDEQSDKVVKAIKLLAEVSHAGRGKAASEGFRKLIDPEDDHSTG